MQWIKKHPRASIERLGLIPSFLSEENPKSAVEQLNDGYAHGGGFRPFKGMTMLPNGNLHYPGDPPYHLLFETSLREEIIRVYDDAWVAVVQPDGTFKVARMD